jgi:hypothetical protein
MKSKNKTRGAVETKTPAKTWTTHDLVTESVTIQAPPNKRGDVQVYAGQEFVFTGTKWITLDNDDSKV